MEAMCLIWWTKIERHQTRIQWWWQGSTLIKHKIQIRGWEELKISWEVMELIMPFQKLWHNQRLENKESIEVSAIRPNTKIISTVKTTVYWIRQLYRMIAINLCRILLLELLIWAHSLNKKIFWYLDNVNLLLIALHILFINQMVKIIIEQNFQVEDL